jgi:DNA-binding response OmpR family regulator
VRSNSGKQLTVQPIFIRLCHPEKRQMRILVIEDDLKMAELLRRGLTREGHFVEVTGDGKHGIELARSHAFDSVILDIMLPGLDGYSVARQLRAEGSYLPILMLTGKDATADIVRGLDAGADDYLTKPFSFEILAARMRVIARRVAAPDEETLQVADLTLDCGTHVVQRAGHIVKLTPTEFVLLEYLMRRAGRVVSRDALIEAVWGIDRDIEANTVDVFVFQLRARIEAGGTRRLIQTVRGFGYTMRETAE